MTPLDTCRKLIELAEKATQPKWFNVQGSLEFKNTQYEGSASIGPGPNGDFIACSRNHGPQIAKALIVAIEALEADCTGHADCNNPGCRTVNKIDALFGGGNE